MSSIGVPFCFPDDVLPPEGTYSSREQVREAINDWARPRGYAFSISKSRTYANGKRECVFSCDRGAGRTPSLSGSRETSTRRTGCLFSVLAKEDRITGNWLLKHRQGTQFHTHNHEPSLHPTAHPSHRQLSREDQLKVQNLSNAGIVPKKIRSYLREHSDTIATQQDIYNCISESKRALAKGQSTIHALADELNKEGFWSRICLDDKGVVTAVIFAHPDSLLYVKSYPEVLIMDCTYKTNKYKMPLLDIVGIDACQKTFCVAFAFLSGEEEADFNWALTRLRSLFEEHGIGLPSVILTDRQLALMNAISSLTCFPEASLLLCIWHINKAVLSNCMPAFAKGRDHTEGIEEWREFYRLWQEIAYSKTKEAYNERLQKFRERYEADHLIEVGYIITIWLEPHKEKFVRAWTDQWLHFEQYATSRCEGIHHLVKSDMNSSQADLFEAWRVIKRVITNQLSEIQANQARQQVTTPNIQESMALYDNIRGWVSHEAILRVEGQRKRLLSELPACTGVFSKTTGLPCAHIILPLQQKEECLQISHFHSHWRYRRPGSPQLIIQPRRHFDRLAIRSVVPLTSTQREPSLIEHVEKQIQQKKPPKCSACGEEGHTRVSRTCPLRHNDLRISPAPIFKPPPRAPSLEQPAFIFPRVTTTMTTTTTTTTTIYVATSPVTYPSLPLPAREPSPPRYDRPEAIYARYKASREAWYATLPPRSRRNDKAYRKAKGLPARYPKASVEYALDWKRMGRQCDLGIGKGKRDWIQEEINAYLDFEKTEEERVNLEEQIRLEEGYYQGRNGIQDCINDSVLYGQARQAYFDNWNPYM
ncbi:PKS-NRPS hybrid synthetase [Fusarium oxysporum f. sp. conglutinans]|nr:PKS-NRPS hybrid synthetase [Fusarium oxysporum f. sp. conglutinans]KAH7459036.1 hypothetical protein FOMA001_g20349 [Fusarium oxysporum f. sp. matthiolae]